MDRLQRERFVNAVLQLPSMSNDAIRNDVVAELPSQLRDTIERRSQPYADVNRIVARCDAVPNGIHELMNVLASYEKNSISLQHAMHIWHSFFYHNQLLTLFRDSQIEYTILVAAYRKSIPRGREPNPQIQSANEINYIISELSQLTHHGYDGYPLLEFVERVALAIDDDYIRNELQDWADHAAENLSVDGQTFTVQQLRQKLVTEIQTEAQGKWIPHLLVELDPDQVGSTKQSLYRIEITFWDEQKKVNTWHCDSKPVALEQVPALLTSVLKEHHVPRDKFVMEFLLPDELLSHCVDEWEDKRFRIGGVTYGLRCPVIVRSLTRVKEYELLNYCRKKWQHFFKISQPTSDQIFWICAQEQNDLLDLLYEIDNSEAVPCMGLTFTLDALSNTNNMIDLILDAGLPVALWPRTDLPWEAEDIRTKMLQILSSQPLTKLPYTIFKARYNAYKSGDLNHIAHHLTLLWDDPTRIPAKYDREIDLLYEPEL